MSKNVEINISNGSGYEVLYPKTLGSLVNGSVEKANYSTISGATEKVNWSKFQEITLTGQNTQYDGASTILTPYAFPTVITKDEDVMLTCENLVIQGIGNRNGYSGYISMGLIVGGNSINLYNNTIMLINCNYNETKTIGPFTMNLGFILSTNITHTFSNNNYCYFYPSGQISPNEGVSYFQLVSIALPGSVGIGGRGGYIKVTLVSGKLTVYKRQAILNNIY